MLKRKGFCVRLTLACFLVSLLSVNSVFIPQYDVSAAGTYILNDSLDYADGSGVSGSDFTTPLSKAGWTLNNATTTNLNTYSIKDGALVAYNAGTVMSYMLRMFPSSVTGTDVVVRFKLHLNSLPGADNTNFCNISDGLHDVGTIGFNGNNFKFNWGGGNSIWGGVVANHDYVIRYDISFGLSQTEQGKVSCTVTDVTPGLTAPSFYKWEDKPFKGSSAWNTYADRIVFMYSTGATTPISILIDNLQVYHSATTPDITATTSLDSASADLPVDTVITANFSEDLDASTVNNIKVKDSSGAVVPATVSTVSAQTYMKQRVVNIAFPDRLNFGSNYSLVVPKTVTNIFGNGLASEKIIPFTTKAKPISRIQVSNEKIVDNAGNPLLALTPSTYVTVQADVVDMNTDPDAQMDVYLIVTLTDSSGTLQDISIVQKSVCGGQASQSITAGLTLPSTLPADTTGWHLNAFFWGDGIPGEQIVNKYVFPAI